MKNFDTETLKTWNISVSLIHFQGNQALKTDELEVKGGIEYIDRVELQIYRKND